MTKIINPYSVFILYCTKCGRNYSYGWHEDLLWFPAEREEGDTLHIYFKCPFDNTYTIHAVCPKCQHDFHVSKGIKVIVEKGLRRVVLVCPKCGWREDLDYFLPRVKVVTHTSRFNCIYFKLRKPLTQFLENGIVATMRNRRYLVNSIVFVNSKYPAIVKNVVKATNDNINKYYDISGFTTPKEWINTAIMIHNGKKPKWIIIIERIGEEVKKK